MKSKTPRIDAMLGFILNKYGILGEHTAPEEWVQFARQLELENKALRELLRESFPYLDARFGNSLRHRAEKLLQVDCPDVEVSHDE